LGLPRIVVRCPFDSLPLEKSCQSSAGVLGGHDDRIRAYR
jgi:hypothetical protein